MPIFLYSDFNQTTLAAGIGPSATSITLAPGSGAAFPAPAAGQQFALTLNDALTRNVFEVVYCTARSGDTLTVLRAQEGTSAQSWVIGDFAYNGPTSGQMNNLLQIPHITDSSLDPVVNTLTATGGDIVSTAGNIIASAGRLRAALGALGSGDVDAAVLLQDFPGSFGGIESSGYVTLPNGIIIQWLSLSFGAPVGTFNVNFPTPFPNACFVTVGSVGSGNTTSGAPNAWGGVQPFDNFQCQVTLGTAPGTGTVGMFVIAIGN
jgi:hypothetical protein